jgi:hypothetical protein
MLDARKLKPRDLERGMEIHPRLFGDRIASHEAARKLWRELLASPGFNGVAIVGNGASEHERWYGFGASVFVPDAFAREELNQPRPGLNGRIAGSILKGDSIAFDRYGIARENSGEGLNVVVLAGRWNPALTAENQIDQTCRKLASAFAEVHAGYRFKRLITELNDKQDRAYADRAPIIRIHTEYGDGRALGIVEKADVQACYGSILAPLFFSPDPKWRLSPIEQQLLFEALDGSTDEQLAARLNLSKRVVKSRWLAIFERISTAMPELLPQGPASETSKRGPQKRHLVLAYVRSHPEELRPFLRKLPPQ